MAELLVKPPPIIRPVPPSRMTDLGARFSCLAIKVLASTIRFQIHDPERVLQYPPADPFIFCFWHNRLASSLILHQRYWRKDHPERRLAALVSASRDGGFLARTLELMGIQTVRGSSSRRGPQALRELTSWARKGFDLTITPDGPRGPRYQVQEGVISLAQITSLPILPLSYQLDWKFRLKSWDRFEVPIPFSRGRIILGPMMRAPRRLSPQEREQLRAKLEQQLRLLTIDS
jgi:lysophospholipid acyltransferase (LPLAT)-like uncharacterized protein